jgi:Predicted nucleotide kinase (related to CMP and AMP kinases)
VIIGITGTPGTGKTTVSRYFDIETVDLKQYAEENNMGSLNTQGELEVDIEELRQNPPQEGEGDLIVEGHLAHFIDLDYCVVLRCRPDILRQRLQKRDYSKQKIDENVESEKLDIILSQAVRNQERVLEVNNTDKEEEEVVKEVKQGFQEEIVSYGDVDWSEFI